MDDLTGHGITAGQIIGVETGDRYLHLLIVLAAEALGVTTMSLAPSELGPPASLGRLCDRIIVSQPWPDAGPQQIVVMSPEWLADVVNRPETDPAFHGLQHMADPGAIVRLIKSSGTTGVPKVMGITQRVQQAVIRKALLHAPSWALSRPVYLCLYNFGVRASHSRAMLTLQLGGTIHFTGANAIGELLAAGIGTYALFVAGDLERFVRTLPHGSGPFRLCLDVIGAAVPPRVRQAVRARVTEHIMVTYSSNEVNRVSLVDDDNVGTLFPGVSVRIVDERGRPVPLGRTGLIRIRSDTMTSGYVDAPDLAREAFVDGWFHTSDIGFQPAKGKLVVLGRDDDMLNIGGVKIAPGPIEQSLKAVSGVRDALVTSLEDHLETRTMLIAVEAEPQADATELAERITPIIHGQVSYYQLVVMPEFPRTETGKIQREAVKQLYRRKAQSL